MSKLNTTIFNALFVLFLTLNAQFLCVSHKNFISLLSLQKKQQQTNVEEVNNQPQIDAVQDTTGQQTNTQNSQGQITQAQQTQTQVSQQPSSQNQASQSQEIQGEIGRDQEEEVCRLISTITQLIARHTLQATPTRRRSLCATATSSSTAARRRSSSPSPRPSTPQPARLRLN